MFRVSKGHTSQSRKCIVNLTHNDKLLSKEVVKIAFSQQCMAVLTSPHLCTPWCLTSTSDYRIPRDQINAQTPTWFFDYHSGSNCNIYIAIYE